MFGGVSFGDGAGTPSVLDDDGFRGVVVSPLPANLALARGEGLEVWLHGGYQLDAGQLGRGDSYLDLIWLVIVDETNLATAGRRALGDVVANRRLDPTRLDWSGRTVVQRFHVELGEFFGLPAADADYVVRAIIGPWVSNAARVRVRVDA
jgi:hypothetical protein